MTAKKKKEKKKINKQYFVLGCLQQCNKEILLDLQSSALLVTDSLKDISVFNSSTTVHNSPVKTTVLVLTTKHFNHCQGLVYWTCISGRMLLDYKYMQVFTIEHYYRNFINIWHTIQQFYKIAYIIKISNKCICDFVMFLRIDTNI